MKRFNLSELAIHYRRHEIKFANQRIQEIKKGWVAEKEQRPIFFIETYRHKAEEYEIHLLKKYIKRLNREISYHQSVIEQQKKKENNVEKDVSI